MTEELKPCPFCGGKPLAYDMLESLSICTVECSGCDITVEGRTTQAAATRWNTRALTAAQPAQAGERDTGPRVLREVFALCEDTMTKMESESTEFSRGRAFEAKGISRAIGTWFQDEFCGRSHMGEPVIQPAAQAAQVPDDSALLDHLDMLAKCPAGSDLHCFGGRVVLYVRTGIGAQVEASGAGTAREAIRAAMLTAAQQGANQARGER